MAGRRPRCAGYDEGRPPRSAAPPVEGRWSSGAAGFAKRVTAGWPTSPGRSRSMPRLADDDLVGSIAHVHGLAAAGLLTADEARHAGRRPRGPARGGRRRGRCTWDPALEDVHLNLEAALAQRIGPLAGRLHTGRSRNDQVATDLRLWARRAVDALDAAILAMEQALVGLAERDGDAVLSGHDPHPAGPAGPARPSPARLRRDARTRSRPAGRRPPPVQRLAARVGRAGRSGLSRSTGRRPPRELGFDAPSRQLARCGQRPRLRRRAAGCDRPRHGPPEPAGGGAHLVVESALRLRQARGFILHRQLDDAQQEESRSGRARAGPHRRRDRGADRRAGDAQGPAARLPARPPGGQGATVRGRRYLRSLAGRPGRRRWGRSRSTASGCGRRPRRGSSRRRPWPMRWSERASRSGSLTSWSAASSPRPRQPAWGSRPWTTARFRPRSAPPATRPRRASPRTRRRPAGCCSADVDAALASCDVIGGTAPARVAAAIAAARERLGG